MSGSAHSHLSLRQRKGHEHIAADRRFQFWCIGRQPIPHTAHWHREVLPATDGVRHGIARDLAAQNGLPEDRSGLGVKGQEPTVQVAEKDDVARRRKRRAGVRGPLAVAPLFATRGDVGWL